MTTQLASGSQDSIRSLQHSLIRLLVVLHDMQCVQIFRIETVPAQDLLSEVTLQRRETKAATLVVLEQKLDQCVAQPANTVVEKDWAGSGHHGFSGGLFAARSCSLIAATSLVLN